MLPDRHGSSEKYRYGFQGQEKDDEIKGEGNSLNYESRIYDPRIGRFFSIDKLDSATPSTSGYSTSGNSPLFKIDSKGDIEIVIHFYKKIDGEYYEAGTYTMNITTTEDLKGITRDVMHINAYTRYDDGINQNNEDISKRVAFYSIREGTGLNEEEKLRQEDPLVWGLAKFMQKNPLGTGLLTEAFNGEDILTGEKLTGFGKSLKGIEAIINIASLLTANDASTILRQWALDLGIEEGFSNLLLNDDNFENGALYGKILNFTYATYKMKEIEVQGIISSINAICNKGIKGKELFDEIKSKTGIDLDAPADKHGAAKRAVETFNSEF